MTWTIYAVGAAVALAVADVMVKLAAGKLPNSLGLLLYGSVPFVAGVAWVIYDKSQGVPMSGDSVARFYAIGVGVAFTLVTIALYAAFKAGAPISIVSPLIRVGGLIVASAVGILLWKESVSARYVCGVIMSLVGIYLIVKK